MKSKFSIYLIVLSVICTFIFVKTLSFDYVPYDDPAYISDNHFVKQGFTLESIRWAFLYDSDTGDLVHHGIENLWHPLTWISHMLDVEIFGTENPAGHHGTNLLIYLLTIPFILWSSKRLLGSWTAAFFVSLLWLVHPLKVESVAWLSERKDLLSGLFFWASLTCALQDLTTSSKWKHIGLALFILALLSKPSVIVLPALLVLIHWYLNSESKWNFTFLKQEIKKWWMWFLAAGLVAVITIYMQSGGSHDYFIQQSSLLGRASTAATGFWFYLYRVLIPIDLNFHYAHPKITPLILIVAALSQLALIYSIWKMRHRYRTLFFGVSWFLICWLPASGILYVGSSFTADRYLYLALAGLLFPIAYQAHKNSKLAWLLAPIAMTWTTLSWKQTDVWKNGWTLFEHSTTARPNVAVGWSNLGTMLQRDGKFTEAIEAYKKVSQINPYDYQSQYNLGVIKRKSGDTTAAKHHYERCLEIYPKHLPSALNLGIIFKEQGEFKQAKDLFYLGIDKNIKMLWLACECEMILKNYDQAKLLLRKLETLNIQNTSILEGMKKVSKFLQKTSKINHTN